MNDDPANSRAPARLDDRLVGDLPRTPAFEQVVSTINDQVGFFLTAAADSFSVPSPACCLPEALAGPPQPNPSCSSSTASCTSGQPNSCRTPCARSTS